MARAANETVGASFKREAVVREIRDRAQAGLSVRRHQVKNLGLFDRAFRYFGGWAEALEAAGVAEDGSRRRKAAPRVAYVALTDALLASDLPNRTLARMTGLDRQSIRERRQRLGLWPDGGVARPRARQRGARRRQARQA